MKGSNDRILAGGLYQVSELPCHTSLNIFVRGMLGGCALQVVCFFLPLFYFSPVLQKRGCNCALHSIEKESI